MRKPTVLIVSLMLLLTTGVPSLYAVSIKESLKSLIADGEKSSVVIGKHGWLFLKDELRHLSRDTFYGESLDSDPLAAIVDFNNQLQDKNIDLLLVLVPPKALIYPQMLPVIFTEDMLFDLEKPYLEFYSKLDQKGVTYLNLNVKYRKLCEINQVYCKTDSHFSGKGLEIVAKEIATQIYAKPWYAVIPKEEYQTEYKNITISGDLSQMLGSKEKEELSLRFVRRTETNKAVTPNPDSPVLLLGDSHTLVFSVGGDLHTNGAGLFDNLAAELGFAPDLIGVRGSGATPSRIKLFQRSRKDSSFLRNKKLVVWCLTARELTGSGGWRKIPIEKK